VNFLSNQAVQASSGAAEGLFRPDTQPQALHLRRWSLTDIPKIKWVKWERMRLQQESASRATRRKKHYPRTSSSAQLGIRNGDLFGEALMPGNRKAATVKQDADDPRSIFCRGTISRVILRTLCDLKLVIAILVFGAVGSQFGAAAICAAYCMSSAAAGSAVVHHHQMESQPGPHKHQPFISMAHHKGAECAECPPTSGNTFNQKADCASWVQFQALKEGSFSLDAPSGVAEFEVADTPATPSD